MIRYTTQKEVRDAFWEAHPLFDQQARVAGLRWKRQNEHCATVRCSFVDFVDGLHREGAISDRLASKVTL